ncbi:hypothetical protein C2845_PM03G31430 [Panicum miliaceum]|uniref:RNase H type-1 domain-containing protein n=1 Tax=Panicum miliaceum TaxID=4540 RepID=A0A3L6T3K8_PANMI|nr:hypothetical protein C2845_PM03G31430 [Panicum miliaceum]
MTVAFPGILARKVSNKVLQVVGPVQDFLRAKVSYPLEEALKPTVEVKIKGSGSMFFDAMFCPEDEEVQYVEKGGQLVEKFGEWMRCSPLKKDHGKKVQVPAAPPWAARALNFSGAQLLKIQATSSATNQGSKRKAGEEGEDGLHVDGKKQLNNPKKLLLSVSNELVASVQKLGMGNSEVGPSVQMSLGRKDMVSGLDSFVDSSEYTGSESHEDGKAGWSIQARLQAAKQAKQLPKMVRKPGLRGISPAREIGKTKKTNQTLKAGILEALLDQQNVGQKTLVQDGGVASVDGMEWKEEVIRDLFWPHDAEAILSMRLPSRAAKDFVAWNYEKSGVYSVKSAYRLAKQLKEEQDGGRQSTSGPHEGRPIWNNYWKLPIPHKILIFGWRTVQEGLPTMHNKKKRNLEVVGTCKICGVEEESTMHALVRCSHACTLRNAMRQHLLLLDEEQFLQLTPESLVETIDRLGTDDGVKLLILLWRTWQVRNNLTHESEKLSFAGSIAFLRRYWTELCGVRHHHSAPDAKGKKIVHESLNAGRSNKHKQVSTKWEAPDPTWVKVNVDGAFDSVSGEAGIGIVIRNHEGTVQLTAWKHIRAGRDAEEVECLAGREGLILAAEWCHGKAILETDCIALVNWLNSSAGTRPRDSFILDELREAGSRLPEWRVIHTKRERNRAAP